MPLRALLEQVQKKSRDELNENPGEVMKDLEKIREWAEKQSHLKCRLDDEWLIVFLRGCKFSLEKTKEKLDRFYTVRSTDAQFFGTRNPLNSKIREFIEAGYFVPLPPDTPTSPWTFLLHTPNFDPETMAPTPTMKAVFMMLDVLLADDPACVISGQQILLNAEGFDTRMLLMLTPSILRRIVTYILNAYPLRLKGLHFINSPPIYETIVKLIKSLVSEKLNERIKLYGPEKTSDVYKSIPRSTLPLEYGGSAGPIKDLAANWAKKVESYAEWFREDAEYGVDESKRPEKSRLSSELAGMEGSFRTLDID